jgi:hypothetical protein
VAGYPITKADLDNTMGRLVQALAADFAAIVAFKKLLDDTTILPDGVLTALGYSGPVGTAGTDLQIIRSSFTDLAKLRDISYAQATQSPANDFWFNAKHLTGIAL